MSYPMETVAPEWTVADLLTRFGPIAHRRFRQDPAVGSGTEQDVLDIHAREKRLYELVDGVLVEKAKGIQESFLALKIATILMEFVNRHNLGYILGADGMLRLQPGLVRIPDVSFVSWNKAGKQQVPNVPMLGVAPDLAIEVLSPGNTAIEMTRKRKDYFDAGVRLLWIIDPATRTVQVFTSPDTEVLLQENETLTDNTVLPGFDLPLQKLFAGLEKR
jgi:Uma2 family endonuclease